MENWCNSALDYSPKRPLQITQSKSQITVSNFIQPPCVATKFFYVRAVAIDNYFLSIRVCSVPFHSTLMSHSDGL